jgi:hypothetical protein
MRGMLAVTAFAMILAGCGGAAEAPPPVTVTETASPTAAATTTLGHGGINDQDRVFLSTLQGSSDGDYFSTVPRDQLFDTAHTICTKFDKDGNVATLKSLLDAGMKIGPASAIMLASVTAYCPQNLKGIQ